MTKTAATITFKLDADLRAAFVSAAQSADRTTSQLLRDFMRDFVARREAERAESDLVRARMQSVRDGTAVMVDHADVSAHLKRRAAESMARPKPSR